MNEQDIETVEALSQLGSAQFASDLRSVLEAVRAVSASAEVRHVHIEASFDFQTWRASPIEGLAVHLCQCELCDKEIVRVAWKEQALDASKIRRVLGGIAVAGAHSDEPAEPPWVAGELQGLPEENLRRLVEVTHALDSADAIQTLAGELRRFVAVAPVDYLGLYLIVDVTADPDVTDIVFHWCDQLDCEADPAVGRRRPRNLGSNGMPNPARLCGHSAELVHRASQKSRGES